MRLLGAVLAGGRSSRFGSDKALAMLDGRTLLDHAAAALGAHVETVVICGRHVPGMTGLADRPAADMGPLGGLNAALHHAAAQGYDAVLTTGCDVPVYPDGLAQALIGDGAAILKGQQLAGFWPASLAGELDAHLAEENSRAIHGWLERVGARIVERPEFVLPNINRPEDLERFTFPRLG
ncbi:molybdenum cofactor guanylyltransferase [Sphingobium indicum]|uniref:Molybdenum cofactor guanylyltransferase n=3 Tax=Sphingobium indicum TaxID=332055 RepID=A0A8E0WQX7_9SPHN|nr:molybdenum cofactor guanylyltransferase [Sphingobium indicum]EPR08697.1 molybdopterin-guanine dinucleotide biosynthesis protein MobA [Sphingobium indicum IP26]KEY99659.1 molybdopterin-guanine dinucleotide biosynthesis protein MobA [Sphingomonas sp. BHC-A]APL93149.1 molybdopterin-guanine dinucleotide biosynthesis protein MobA [Sphingobium indicum B90A]KER35687.1 molybdopterin-guanine dinucleotide biosynthesis protein MobA [Sphingobium indicum F2]NYI22219.1 molybdopterin-guanine dinucleotide 